MISHFLPFFVATILLETILFGNVDSAKLGKIDSRIIGGRPARVGEFPHQLQLWDNGSFHCGGTLINSPKTGAQIILTAAHCVTYDGTTTPKPAAQFILKAGATSLNDQTAQTKTIQSMKIHPNYRPLDLQGMPGDIAMLKLGGSFTVNNVVKPLSLPKQGQQTSGNVVVSGWGVTSSNSRNPSQVLRTVQLPVVNSDTCNTWYKQAGGGANMIKGTNFCAGYAQGGKSACFGDSGGPVVGTDSGTYLAGLVSWGAADCDGPKRPSVLTRVSSYISWITNVNF